MILRILLLILMAESLVLGQEKTTPRTDRGKPPAATARPVAAPVPAAPVVPAAITPLPAAAARLSEAISTVAAQTNSGLPPGSSDDLPARMVAEFFGLVAKGQIDEAYANLSKGSKTIEKPEDLRV